MVRYALLCALAFLSARNGVESLVRAVQLVGILDTGAAYYFLVFEPAMLDKPPHQVFATQLAVPYLVPTAVFAVLAFAERLQRQSVRTFEEREQDQIRITVDVATDEAEGGGVGAMVGGLGLPGMAVAGGSDKRE